MSAGTTRQPPATIWPFDTRLSPRSAAAALAWCPPWPDLASPVHSTLNSICPYLGPYVSGELHDLSEAFGCRSRIGLACSSEAHIVRSPQVDKPYVVLCQVLKCVDHKTGSAVAVKIVRSRKRFLQQGLIEVKLLEHLRKQASMCLTATQSTTGGFCVVC